MAHVHVVVQRQTSVLEIAFGILPLAPSDRQQAGEGDGCAAGFRQQPAPFPLQTLADMTSQR